VPRSRPARVIYAPQPVYVRPAPVVYGAPVWVPSYYGAQWRHRHHHHHHDYDERGRYYGPIS